MTEGAIDVAGGELPDLRAPRGVVDRPADA